MYSTGPCEAKLTVSVNARNIMGQTALHDAVTVGYRDAVSLLLKHGADLKLRTEGECHRDQKDTTPVDRTESFGACLSCLEIAFRNGDLDMAKLLLENGAEDQNYKCLRSAVATDNNEAILLLLQQGSTPGLLSNTRKQKLKHLAKSFYYDRYAVNTEQQKNPNCNSHNHKDEKTVS